MPKNSRNDGENGGDNLGQMKLSNDVNMAMSIRRPNGRRITRKEMIKALLAFINAVEDDAEEMLDRVYDDEPYAMKAGTGDEVVIFGAMFSDGFVLKRAMDGAQQAMQDAADNASASRGGGTGGDDPEEITQPYVDQIKRMIEEEERKNGTL